MAGGNNVASCPLSVCAQQAESAAGMLARNMARLLRISAKATKHQARWLYGA